MVCGATDWHTHIRTDTWQEPAISIFTVQDKCMCPRPSNLYLRNKLQGGSPPPKKGNPSFLNLFINAISMNISQIFVLRHIFEQRLAATLSSRKSQLYPQPVHVGPVMYEKVPKQTYIPVSMLYPFNINPPMILTHSFIYQRR